VTLRLSRWRLLWFHGTRERCFRAKGLGPVYRWAYRHDLIEAVDGMWTRITPKGRVVLDQATEAHRRHGRTSPWHVMAAA
jgi:hypothetical protein